MPCEAYGVRFQGSCIASLAEATGKSQNPSKHRFRRFRATLHITYLLPPVVMNLICLPSQIRGMGKEQSPFIEELKKAEEDAQIRGAGMWNKVGTSENPE